MNRSQTSLHSLLAVLVLAALVAPMAGSVVVPATPQQTAAINARPEASDLPADGWQAKNQFTHLYIDDDLTLTPNKGDIPDPRPNANDDEYFSFFLNDPQANVPLPGPIVVPP